MPSAIKWAASAVLLGVAMIVLLDAWAAWHRPWLYPFGGDGPGASLWAYRSRQHYLIASALSAGACCLALAGVWQRKVRRSRDWLWFLPLLAWGLVIVVEWLAVFD